MSREKKRGTSGNAKAYITRAKALRKLQLSLPEFRRLCILKGIYPRDPKKKTDGSDKTYYLRKDIDFLAHERLIAVMRAQAAHKKKVVKATAKKRRDVLRALARSAPKARLDHIVLERYPHFSDALRELDDPLCTVALFANLPANHKLGIAPSKVAICRRLLREFHHFIADTGTLRKVFVSIKGYYFQAVVQGHELTWITPHRFSQMLPQDVDYSVMLTFLDLYRCILSFVNFKLYTSRNLAYPPKFSREALRNGLELGALESIPLDDTSAMLMSTSERSSSLNKQQVVSDDKISAVAAAAATMVAREDESDDEGVANEDTAPQSTENVEVGDNAVEDKEDEDPRLSVFKGKSIVIGRETPYIELEFVLRAAGAALATREDDLPSDTPDRAVGYTHWIIDRPAVLGRQNMSIDYVQPQYVFDSINTGVLLPPSLYRPGAKLPPHLSPFVEDDVDGGYRPWYKDILDRIKAGDESVVAEAAAVVYAHGQKEDAVFAGKQAKVGTGKEESGGQHKADPKASESGTRSRKRKGRGRHSDKSTEKVVESDTDGATVPGSSDKTQNESSAVESSEDMQNSRNAAEERRRGTDALHPDEENKDVEGSHDTKGESDADDDEDDIVQAEQVKVEQEEKEGNELAKMMMSRKKMRKYQHFMREEKAKQERKAKLTAKRRALENASKHPNARSKRVKRR